MSNKETINSEFSTTADMVQSSKRQKKGMEDNNPCYKEMQLAYKCLDKYNPDKEACMVYYVNYNTCQKFWNDIFRERRSQGIRPFMPPPEEREKIAQERLARV